MYKINQKCKIDKERRKMNKGERERERETDRQTDRDDTHVLPGFLTPVLTPISFQSHRLLFSHASTEVRGENTPERKFASTGSENGPYSPTIPKKILCRHHQDFIEDNQLVNFDMKKISHGDAL